MLNFEDAAAVGKFLARTVEYRLAWEDFDAGRWNASYEPINRLFCEKQDAFDGLGVNARWFVDGLGEFLTIIREGFYLASREPE